MSFAPHLVPLAAFAGLMATAAVEDFRRLIIPNALTFGLCLLWPIHLVTAPALTATAVLAAIGCAGAVFVCGAVLFARGLIGGGDVKLLAAAALWAGPDNIPTLLVLTGLLGGLLCLVVLSPLGAQIAAAGQPTVAGAGGDAANGDRPAVVPYGVAIAAAALITTIPPNFG